MCFILQIKLVLQPLPSATLTQGTVCVLYTYYIRLSLLLLYYSIYMCVCICVCVCVCCILQEQCVVGTHSVLSALPGHHWTIHDPILTQTGKVSTRHGTTHISRDICIMCKTQQ